MVSHRVHGLGEKRIIFLNIQQVGFEMGENSLCVIFPSISSTLIIPCHYFMIHVYVPDLIQSLSRLHWYFSCWCWYCYHYFSGKKNNNQTKSIYFTAFCRCEERAEHSLTRQIAQLLPRVCGRLLLNFLIEKWKLTLKNSKTVLI